MGGFCPHITCPRPKPATLAEEDNGGTGRRVAAAGGRGQGLSRGNCSGQGVWPQYLNGGRQSLSLLDSLTWGNTADHPSPCSTPLLTWSGQVPEPAFGGPCSPNPAGARSGRTQATLPTSLRKAAWILSGTPGTLLWPVRHVLLPFLQRLLLLPQAGYHHEPLQPHLAGWCLGRGWGAPIKGWNQPQGCGVISNVTAVGGGGDLGRGEGSSKPRHHTHSPYSRACVIPSRATYMRALRAPGTAGRNRGGPRSCSWESLMINARKGVTGRQRGCTSQHANKPQAPGPACG